MILILYGVDFDICGHIEYITNAKDGLCCDQLKTEKLEIKRNQICSLEASLESYSYLKFLPWIVKSAMILFSEFKDSGPLTLVQNNIDRRRYCT